jgi:hypothetical protein
MDLRSGNRPYADAKEPKQIERNQKKVYEVIFRQKKRST